MARRSKREKKRSAGRVWMAIACVAGAILLLFEAGTLFPTIPVFGSVGSYFTMLYGHVALVVVLCLAIAGIVLLFCKRLPKTRVVACVLLCAVCAINFYCYFTAVADCRKAGADVGYNFFLSFAKKDFPEVKTETVPYVITPYGESELNVYYTNEGTDKPVILYVHGGGWIQGSKEDHTYESKLFARRGFVVVSADYVLSTADRHRVGKTEEELTHAFAWVKNNIASYGGNADELYALGDSAGGNLALELAYKINAGIYTEADGTALPKVRKVTALYPVVSPKSFYENDDVILGASAKKMATQYIGKTPEEDPDLYETVTPTNFLSSETPATLLIVGTGDRQVQPEQSYALAERLEKNGTEIKTVTVRYCNHAFDNADGSFACLAVVDLTAKFFGR